jgi:hypothetical protein
MDVASRPDWDKTHFVVAGGSQGGQALVTAGLSPRVTALAADVPALCDLTGNAVGRYDGWPLMVEPDARGGFYGKGLKGHRFIGFMRLQCGCKEAVTAVHFLGAGAGGHLAQGPAVLQWV